ncbi:hypothetical protein CEXT_731861 [Caerostris extrusa]|uniref:Uncharacterized protein n=1 Tax=Caerostris extrusa TaxID=172846 RepID=A0AAV4NB09_CAEEX|nr:hypothetical protein CEXT_731861 [Caerostris extrusa]
MLLIERATVSFNNADLISLANSLEDLKENGCRILTADRKSDSLISVNLSTQGSSDTKTFVTVKDRHSPGCMHRLEPVERKSVPDFTAKRTFS